MHREAAWRGDAFPGLELCRLDVERDGSRLEGSCPSDASTLLLVVLLRSPRRGSGSPALTVEVIEQSYERTSDRGYRYRAGSFTADLEVDDAGLVLDHPGLWKRVDAG